MPTRHVLVVSQQALFREGLRRLLSNLPGVHLLDAVSSSAEAEELAKENPLDVIVVSSEENDLEQVADLL